MSKKNGILITLEGGDGVGKTTMASSLRARLDALAIKSLLVREPGGTKISEKIRSVVLDSRHFGTLLPMTEVFLFQASRAQIYGELVTPSLSRGELVIMDRSSDSSLIYQGIVRGLGRELIRQLNSFSTVNTVPDLTFLLDTPVEVSLARSKQAGVNNRIDIESIEFHQKVRQAYLQLAEEDDGNRWRVVDASRDFTLVEQEVWQTIYDFLTGSGYLL